MQNTYFNQKDLNQIQNYVFEAPSITLSKLKKNGLHFLNQTKGQGSDFRSIDPYQPFDDTRHIHWKISAKKQTPFVKRYHRDDDRFVCIVMEQASELFFGSSGMTKSNAIAHISAYWFYLLRSQDYQLKLYIVDDNCIDQFQSKQEIDFTQALIKKNQSLSSHTLDAKKSLVREKMWLESLMLCVNLLNSDLILITDIWSFNEESLSLLNQISHQRSCYVFLIMDSLETQTPLNLKNFFISHKTQNYCISSSYAWENILFEVQKRKSFLKEKAPLVHFHEIVSHNWLSFFLQ